MAVRFLDKDPSSPQPAPAKPEKGTPGLSIEKAPAEAAGKGAAAAATKPRGPWTPVTENPPRERQVGAPKPLTDAQKVTQARAQLEVLRQAASDGKLPAEEVLARVSKAMQGLPLEASAGVLAEAALGAAQSLYESGEKARGDDLVGSALEQLRPALATPGIEPEVKAQIAMVVGLEAQSAAQLGDTHRRLQEQRASGAGASSLDATLQKAEADLAERFATLESSLVATRRDAAKRAASSPQGSAERRRYEALTAEVDRYRRAMGALHHQARAGLFARAGRPEAQLAAIRRELSATVGPAAQQLASPQERRTVVASGEQARWSDWFGTTTLAALSPGQVKELEQSFEAPFLTEEDRNRALDGLSRYARAAQASGNLAALHTSHQLLEALKRHSTSARVDLETQLAGAQLHLARGDAQGALILYRGVERQVRSMGSEGFGMRDQLERSVLAQATILESLARRGPEATRAQDASALRGLRQRYESDQGPLSLGAQVELSMAEGRAFLRSNPKETVATLEALKARYGHRDGEGHSVVPGWLRAKLERFDAQYKDAAPVAAAQAFFAEASDGTENDLLVGGVGFAVGAVKGMAEGAGVGASVGSLFLGEGALPGGIAGAAVGALSGGAEGAGLAVAAYHAYRGISGLGRVLDAATTGYNPESLADSLWNAGELALIGVGAGIRPIGAKGLETAQKVAQNVGSQLETKLTEVGMSELERAHFELVRDTKHHAKTALMRLSPEELGRIFPDGVVPDAFKAVADVWGFEQVAREMPETVRFLTAAQERIPTTMNEVRRVWGEESRALQAQGHPVGDATEALALSRAYQTVARDVAGILESVGNAAGDPRRALFPVLTYEAVRELSKLSPQQVAALYPEGGLFPVAFSHVAQLPGFAELATQAPQDVRTVADVLAMYPHTLEVIFQAAREEVEQLGLSPGAPGAAEVFQAAYRKAFARTAQEGREVLPIQQTSAHHSGFWSIRPQAKTPESIPDLVLLPKRELDWNGAFQQQAASASERASPSSVPHLGFPSPEQLVVDGMPLATLDGVAYFGTHGSRELLEGFGKDMQAAARFIADEVQGARTAGTKLDYLVLAACEQRDLRWLRGGSNAQALQRALDQELARRGQPALRVLAAENGGSVTQRGSQSVGPIPLRLEGGRVKLGYREDYLGKFRPADEGPRIHLGRHELQAAKDAGPWAVGALGVSGGIYEALVHQNEVREGLNRLEGLVFRPVGEPKAKGRKP